MASAQVIVRTVDDLRAGLRARKQAPDRDYLRKRYPHAFREVPKKGGGKEWRVGGTRPDGTPYLSRAEQRELNGSLSPFMRAEGERCANIMAREPKQVPLRDAAGVRRWAPPHTADAVARANGWKSGDRPRGNPVLAGEGEMLWKLLAGEWHPLGVRCLGTPLSGRRTVSRRSIQRDPDGKPWRWIAGRWRVIGG